MNGDDAEARPVLGPAGNKARAVPSARKPSPKPSRKPEKESGFNSEEKKSRSPSSEPRPLVSALSAPSALRRHELLMHSNLSLTASCSSDASTDSFCSRASTGRIGRTGLISRRKQCVPRPEKIAAKLEKIALDSSLASSQESLQLHGKRRCAWVTPNTGLLFSIVVLIKELHKNGKYFVLELLDIKQVNSLMPIIFQICLYTIDLF